MNLENLKAAVELHRPDLRNRYGLNTTDPEKVVHRRCNECHINVPERGCATWATANGIVR